jgi:FdhE protein
MTKAGLPGRDPVPIGEVATPAFTRLPDPPNLFGARARRFRNLADGHDLEPYLLFLADLAEAQDRVQVDLPEPTLPEPDALRRAREFGMPPLDRNRFVVDPVFDTTLDRLLLLAEGIPMPDSAAAARGRTRAADAIARESITQAVLADSIPIEAMAEHGYVAAALQVHFARLAARLDPRLLVPVGDGVCPVCGGPPAASMVVGWQGAHGTRYCGCGLCGTLWNYVRIKCALCASTKGIGYQEIEGGPGTVKAETCDSCRGYLKVLQQHKDPGVDIIADDVASLGLDLLVHEAGFRRGGVNPFLLGY